MIHHIAIIISTNKIRLLTVYIYIDYTYVFATLKCEILNEKMQFFELQWHLKIVVKSWEKNF